MGADRPTNMSTISCHVSFPRRHFLSLPNWLGLSGLLCLGLVRPYGAGAESAPPVPLVIPLLPEARAAVDRGLAATRTQNYVAAVRAFQEARQTAPIAPEILYDLGEAESKIPGREMRAVCWYAAFLTVSPAAPQADVIKKEIIRLEAKYQETVRAAIQSVQKAVARTAVANQILPSLIALWAEAGDPATAVKTADQIEDTQARHKALEHFVIETTYWDDVPVALKAAEQISDEATRDSLRNTIARIQAESGDITAALQTVNLLQDQGLKDNALATIARVQLKTGDIAAAQQTTGQIVFAGLRDRSLVAIAEAQASLSAVLAAKATAELLSTEAEICGGMAAIAVVQAKSGDPAGAHATFAQAMERAARIGDITSQRNAHIRILRAQAKTGDMAGAMQTLATIPLTIDKDSILQGIALDLAGAGKGDDAVSVSALISDSEMRDFAQDLIASYQLNLGDVASAKNTVNLLGNLETRIDAEFGIAQAQARLGNIAGAQATIGLVQNPYGRCKLQILVAVAQATAGDAAGVAQTLASAEKELGLIEEARDKREMTWDIAEARFALARAITANRPADPASGRRPAFQLFISADLRASEWLRHLERTDPPDDHTLSLEPLLNFAADLAAQRSADPAKELPALIATVEEIKWIKRNLNGGWFLQATWP